ncbi:MAG: NDP-hexose 2,3-dehydratase [Candidatus Magasanikbacteria bacterium GW2011_GWC2_40_17]|uniref:NDP-hexose 2,3-dehydratase n=1 Tax=Candidatus Magasanikbacteria bacterium GW2011_GWA2_42_32 TaxID=1619039 RepID=A0A0G1A877_9BACT|nr:MAG: NDP-hexose 2,3-dehydratase [Candidatus Magasanikbacteria bacterium GW2011_GWC2_40_17]KKS57119.1 MAG: NDP-hexose 2,3-dehydratase [Candidatus Magasanikbacteria bacterium GW2011_GWA2_42_32]
MHMPAETWWRWLARQRERSQMVVLPNTRLDSLGGGWGFDGTTFARADGKFFGLEGVEVRTAGREVPGWGQPLLKEYGVDGSEDGVVVVPVEVNSFGHVQRVLLAARIEPGNPATYNAPGVHAPDSKKHVLIGTPLQTSVANLSQAHGGKLPPRAELVTMHANKYSNNPLIRWVTQPQDGGRYFGKSVRLGRLIVKEGDLNPLLPQERWFYPSEINSAFAKGELSNYLVQSLLLFARF